MQYRIDGFKILYVNGPGGHLEYQAVLITQDIPGEDFLTRVYPVFPKVIQRKKCLKFGNLKNKLKYLSGLTIKNIIGRISGAWIKTESSFKSEIKC